MDSILIAQLGGWSDTVLSSFIVPALKEKYPGARMTLLLGKSLSDWAVSLHFDEVEFIDDRAFFSGKPLKQVLSTAGPLRELRRRRFDLGVSLHNTWGFAPLLRAAGCQKTAGFLRADQKAPAVLGGVKPFDINVPYDKDMGELDRYLALLSALEVNPRKLNFKLKVRQQIHDDIMLRLAHDGLRSKGFIAVAPAGGENVQRVFHHKRWSYFPELLRTVLEKTKWPVLLLGGPRDRHLESHLTHIDSERVVSWIGKTTREEALAVIGEALAFVGNESGPAHVAGSAGTPGIVLFGPTFKGQRQPVGSGKNIVCLQGVVPCSPCAREDGSFDQLCRDNVCMKSISPGDVFKALVKIAEINIVSDQPIDGPR